MMKKYTGSFRTSIPYEDIKELKRLASRKGYTLYGYIDMILKGHLQKEAENEGQRISE